MSLSKCKGCGADIIWIKTPKGKNAPVDAKSVSGYELEAEGSTVNGIIRKIHISHHATCPDVERFRNRGKS